MPHSDPKRALIAAASAALLAATLAGCSSASPAARHSDAAHVKNGAAQVKVTLTGDDGGTCSLDSTTAAAGPVTFTVQNKTAAAITEVELQSGNRIIGEKENLAPGLDPVSFTVTLGGGSYQVYCPGAKKELQTFTVTGKAAARPSGSTADLLADGTTGYGHYVDGVVDAMVTAVDKLTAAVDDGDLAAAKSEYPLARPFYERIESDVDGFVLPGHKATDNAGNLDYLIDMRASNLDPKVGWHGFHAIERDLYKNGEITATTKKYAAELKKNVHTLRTVVGSLTYKPEDLANGAADLLEEVQSTKITGEEEAYSHIDLVDFAGNVEGARQAFAYLEPGLKKIDPGLTSQVSSNFATVETLLDHERDAKAPGGFRAYTGAVKSSDGPKLSRAVQALQEPLSKIAEKVATAG